MPSASFRRMDSASATFETCPETPRESDVVAAPLRLPQIVGQEAPFRIKAILALRVRELALVNRGIEGKLRLGPRRSQGSSHLPERRVGNSRCCDATLDAAPLPARDHARNARRAVLCAIKTTFLNPRPRIPRGEGKARCQRRSYIPWAERSVDATEAASYNLDATAPRVPGQAPPVCCSS